MRIVRVLVPACVAWLASSALFAQAVPGLIAANAAASAVVTTPVAPGQVVATTGSVTEVVVAAADIPTNGETTVGLDIGFGIRPVPASRVTVPVGEKLTVTAPALEGVQYLWIKNGGRVAGATTNVLSFDHVTSGDAGTYHLLYSTPTTRPRPSQVLILGVGPTTRLTNVSVRGALRDGGGESFIAGFVVASGLDSKKMLIRAVGPSLAMFDISRPLARPVLRVFDSQGREQTNLKPNRGIAGGPDYLDPAELVDALSRVGALPTTPGSADIAMVFNLGPGAYTAQVTSTDGAGGEVLVEIYEVP